MISVQNKILKFDFNIKNEVIKGIIDEENKIITFNAVRLNLDNLSPIIEISENATISPTLDSNHNFNNPIDYVVCAENGDTSTYTIVINNREVNTENFITHFWITVGDKILEADIDNESIRIMLDVGQIELSSITPSITISEYANISDYNLPKDFREPTNYKVTAENGDVKEYTVFLNNPRIDAIAYGNKFYVKAKLYVLGDFLFEENETPVAYISDGVNSYFLPLLDKSYSEYNYKSRTNVIVQIPENIPTNDNYTLYVGIDNSFVEYDQPLNILSQNYPKLTSLNTNTLKNNDTMIINEKNLGVIGVQAENIRYIISPYYYWRNTTLNNKKTEFTLLIDGRTDFLINFSGQKEFNVFLMDDDRRYGESFQIKVAGIYN